jgi:hypothetical protein
MRVPVNSGDLKMKNSNSRKWFTILKNINYFMKIKKNICFKFDYDFPSHQTPENMKNIL